MQDSRETDSIRADRNAQIGIAQEAEDAREASRELGRHNVPVSHADIVDIEALTLLVSAMSKEQQEQREMLLNLAKKSHESTALLLEMSRTAREQTRERLVAKRDKSTGGIAPDSTPAGVTPSGKPFLPHYWLLLVFIIMTGVFLTQCIMWSLK